MIQYITLDVYKTRLFETEINILLFFWQLFSTKKKKNLVLLSFKFKIAFYKLFITR